MPLYRVRRWLRKQFRVLRRKLLLRQRIRSPPVAEEPVQATIPAALAKALAGRMVAMAQQGGHFSTLRIDMAFDVLASQGLDRATRFIHMMAEMPLPPPADGAYRVLSADEVVYHMRDDPS